MTVSQKKGSACPAISHVDFTVVEEEDPASWTVIKQVTNDDGGSASPGSFNLTVSINGSNQTITGSSSGQEFTLDAGDNFSLVGESGPSGYQSSTSGTCSGTAEAGQNLTCTITNDDQPFRLTVIKKVTNDDGGNASPEDFTMTINGVNNASPGNSFSGDSGGTTITFDGDGSSYSVSESGPSGYSEGQSAGCSGTATLGGNATCTITNDDVAPSLTLSKQVINDHGGTAGVNDFGLSIGGTPVSSGETLAVNANQPISIDETGLIGYEFVQITGNSKCPDALGGTVTLDEGENLNCTIVNDDIAPALTIIKQVTNDNGGDAVPGDFTIAVEGTNVSPSSFPGSSAGTTVTLDAGSFEVSETGGPDGYIASFNGECSGTISVGESNTCTITNDDQPGSITVIKEVVGEAPGSAWSFSGPDGSFTVPASGGTTPFPDLDTSSNYTISETTKTGYAVSIECGSASSASAAGSSVTVSLVPGEDVTCTFTNTRKTGEITFVKDVVGGTASPSEWTFDVSGPETVTNIAHNSSETLDTGSYTVTESGPSEYNLTGASGECSFDGSTVTLNVTESGGTCTVTNTRKTGTIIVEKVTDPSGSSQNFDFTTGGGLSPTSFSLQDGQSETFNDVPTGSGYSVDETVPTGWELKSAACDDGSPISDIDVGENETVTCTFTNDPLPSISVTKSADPGTVPEPGGNVTYTITVTNNRGEPVDITSITDSQFGDLSTDCPITSLAASSSDSCTFTQSLSGNAGETHQNTVTVNGEDDENNPASDSDSANVTFTDVPSSLTVSKSPTPASLPEPGGDVTYTVTVENTSTADTVTLNSVDEDDTNDGTVDQTFTASAVCNDTVLDPGESTTCTFARPVSGNAGDTVTDQVTVDGTDDDGNAVSDSATADVGITDVLPDITVSKLNDANGNSAFSDDETTSQAGIGQLVDFQVTITNNTGEDLTLDSIGDNVHSVSTGDCPWTTIPANGTLICTFSGNAPDDDNQTEVDTVTVVAEDDDGNSTGNVQDISTVRTPDILPDITVSKSANDTTPAPGATVTYTVTVTNNTDEDVDVTSISDDTHTLNNTCASSFVGTTVPAGSSVSCTFTATAPPDETSVTNEVTVEVQDDDTNKASASDTETIQPDIQPSMNLSKEEDQTIVSGGTASFTITVENTGNVALSSVSVSDANCDAAPAFQSGDTDSDSQLDTTETWTYSCQTINVTADFTNTAEAQAQDPLGNTVGPVSDTATVDVINPAISIEKTADTQQVTAGGTVNFSIAVTNNGNVPLSNVQVSDAQCDTDPQFQGGDDGNGELDVNETWSYTCQRSNVTQDFTNIAEAQAEDPLGNTVGPVSDSVDVNVLVSGAIAVHKVLDSGSAPLSSFCFTLDPDPGIGEICADGSGTALFNDVPEGTYDALETTAPAEFSQVASTCEDLTIASQDETIDCTIRNGITPNLGTVVVPPPPTAGGGASLTPLLIINEIGWSGTHADPSDEWIELKNNSERDIDLTGWTLTWKNDSDNKSGVLVPLSGTIPANGFYLLEHRHEQTISDFDANLIYSSGRLSDRGERMALIDPSGRVVDTANQDGGRWPAGTGEGVLPSYASMERVDPLAPDVDSNWSTNNGVTRFGLDAQGERINGTRMAPNSVRKPQVYQSGDIIPIRFVVTDRNGDLVTDAHPTLSAVRVTIADGEEIHTAIPDTWTFEFDPSTGEYVLEFDTADLGPGLYDLWVNFGMSTGGQKKLARIEIR